MSFTVTSGVRKVSDHFEPETLDPQQQRQMRGFLEQIDYAAHAANREVLGHAQGQIDLGAFERLAVSAAQARARWVTAAVSMTKEIRALNAEETAHLAALRQSWEELTEVYEAMRRLVERGYVAYRPKT